VLVFLAGNVAKYTIFRPMRRLLDLLKTKLQLSPANRLTRDEPPIQLEATTIPTHNRIGRGDDERRLSRRPVAPKEHPKQLVQGWESGAGVSAFEHRQLLAQGKILNQ
jgi:hypothetical protein